MYAASRLERRTWTSDYTNVKGSSSACSQHEFGISRPASAKRKPEAKSGATASYTTVRIRFRYKQDTYAVNEEVYALPVGTGYGTDFRW